jgi:uncharacterized membrane protein
MPKSNNSNIKTADTFSDEAIHEIILSVIKKKRPETIESLIEFITSDYPISDDDILRNIQELEDEKKVEFYGKIFPVKLKEYLFSLKSLWYWGIIVLVILANFLIFLAPSDNSILLLVRNFVGLAIVFYLPGYSIIKVLYPVSVPFKTQSNMLDAIERIALSLGLSLAVVPVVGFALYYLPFGLDLFPLSESLFSLTLVLSTLAIMREYKARRAMYLRRVRKSAAYFTA